MKLTNNEIYTHAKALMEAFKDNTQYLPIKINFFIQKNRSTLFSLAQDIDTARLDIIKNYGELDEKTGDYLIPSIKVEEAQRELNDLFSLEQEVNIGMINSNDLPDDLSITTGQMNAILFMIQ